MPFNTFEVEQQRGLNLGHDPANAVLVCGQTGSGVQQGSVKGEAGGHRTPTNLSSAWRKHAVFSLQAMLIL